MNQKYFLWKIIISAICILFIASCKVPYDPPIKTAKEHYLVVDGFMNADGMTDIRLTRTRNITWGDTAAYIVESSAYVVIEDENNQVMPLYEGYDGHYLGSYSLTPGNKYRLRITTSDQKEYLSDFVRCKITPPIDNLGWKFKDGNVQVFVNTHDPNNSTTYYRWDYLETWEFHSDYYSKFKYDPDSKKVVNRTQPVFVCYRTRNASKIFLGSSANLKEDVIHEGPLELIPNHDKRISVLYSTLVTQYALDSAGYNYWYAMKSNTENVGSIFDPQPNQTSGNIHCITDSSERVIGYVGAGTIQQQRLFISNSDMPFSWNQAPNCSEYDVPTDSLEFYFGNNSLIPYETDPPASLMINGYFSASATCVDCTLTGTLDKPTFWP
jgi:hypothetical protein